MERRGPPGARAPFGHRARTLVIPISLILEAYRSGFFPMGGDDGEIHWYNPDPRGVLPLDRFHVSKRLLRVVRGGRFEIRVDTVFDAVMAACADRRTDGTWITHEIFETYRALHRLGYAHSVEAWHDGRLAGGLYGVSLQGAFFGESMFTRVSDASKVALTALVDRLRSRGYRLLDVQWVTPHLARFGAIEVPRLRYLQLLQSAMRADCAFR
jgi:leucyl/phenylalanyl-tRNA--protein transferase